MDLDAMISIESLSEYSRSYVLEDNGTNQLQPLASRDVGNLLCTYL